MGFKDQLRNDLKVFMNPDELADTHDIDGEQITCVFDDTYQSKNSRDGVYGNVATLHVKTSDLPDRPVPGQRMRVDGDRLTVQKCNESDGMLEITLEANEA